MKSASIEKFAKRLDEVIADGKAILLAAGWTGLRPSRTEKVDLMRCSQVMAEAAHVATSLCSRSSTYAAELTRRQTLGEKPSLGGVVSNVARHVGLLEALRRDLQAGTLVDLRGVLRAEVFDDFLEQAEHLHQEGHHVPAASLGGAVLEDALRRIADKIPVKYPERTSITALAQDLRAAGALDAGEVKYITAVADTRNNADHGHFERVTEARADELLRFVRRFVHEHLS